MKFYKSKQAVVVQSNESFFKALRFTFAFIAVILIAVLFGNEPGTREFIYTALLFLLILVMIFIQLVIEIDVSGQRYRQGFRLFGLNTASWIKVNKISYISIFPTLGSNWF